MVHIFLYYYGVENMLRALRDLFRTLHICVDMYAKIVPPRCGCRVESLKRGGIAEEG